MAVGMVRVTAEMVRVTVEMVRVTAEMIGVAEEMVEAMAEMVMAGVVQVRRSTRIELGETLNQMAGTPTPTLQPPSTAGQIVPDTPQQEGWFKSTCGPVHRDLPLITSWG